MGPRAALPHLRNFPTFAVLGRGFPVAVSHSPGLCDRHSARHKEGVKRAEVLEGSGLGECVAENLAVLEDTAVPDTVWAWRISRGGSVCVVADVCPRYGVADSNSN